MHLVARGEKSVVVLVCSHFLCLFVFFYFILHCVSVLSCTLLEAVMKLTCLDFLVFLKKPFVF